MYRKVKFMYDKQRFVAIYHERLVTSFVTLSTTSIFFKKKKKKEKDNKNKTQNYHFATNLSNTVLITLNRVRRNETQSNLAGNSAGTKMERNGG